METLTTIMVAGIAGAQICFAVSRVKRLRWMSQYFGITVGVVGAILPLVALVALVCTTMLQHVQPKRTRGKV